MSRFVSAPNLPGACTSLIYGQKYAEILQNALDLRHIESILLPDNPDIDPRLAGHTDLSLLHAGGEKLFLAPYLKGSAFADNLRAQGAELVFPSVQQNRIYPGDVQFNVCLVGEYVISNRETAALEIVEYLTNSEGKRLIPARQGYSRCAVCVVNADSIITADRGIAAAAEANGLQVLLIQPGFIRLDGFPYGFIGGAAFRLSCDKLAFTGSLDAHPDRNRILSFLDARSIEPVFLSREPIFDIGSAVPIFEN